MIPNITRGASLPGVMAYLASAGKANEHSEPHLVAGSSAVMAWHGDDQLSRRAALAVGYELDRPRTVSGVRVTQPVKNDEGVKVGVKDAHVWHCSLSLHPDEPARSDEEWAHISEDFVQRMGFVGEDRQPCRWVAVHHGRSAGGNDHVHIVVGLVHEDATKANVHNDRSRAQKVAGELERKYDLRVLESREAGLGSRGTKPAEQAKATGPETDAQRMARTVRACAAAAGDEAEFVRRVRQAGLRARPRFAAGRDDVVLGFSVATRSADGTPPTWYGGGRLARDLSLPRLRADWPTSPEAATAAVAEWTAARRNQPPVHSGREAHSPDPQMWAQYTQEVAQLREQLHAVPDDDRAQWAQVARDSAGAFAAWSLRAEGDTPGPLAATADVLARSAQLRAHQVRPRRAAQPSARGAALLLASVAHGGKGTVAQAVLLRQLANTAKALYDAHLAAGDAQRASEIAAVVRGQLAAVAATLPGEAGEQPIDWQAAEAVRIASQGQLPIREPGAPVPAPLEGPPGRPPTRAPQPTKDTETQR